MPWENSRPTHVPKTVREQCLRRDGNQCVAQLNDGSRCPETRTKNLEAAHLAQWSRGEITTVNDVRTLCRWHHNRETQAQAASKRTRPGSSARPAEQHPGRA